MTCFSQLVAITLVLVSAVCASPRPQESTPTTSCTTSHTSENNGTAIFHGGVVTVTTTILYTPPPTLTTSSSSESSTSSSSTQSSSSSGSSTISGPVTIPTTWLTITAERSGSPLHLLPVNAAGLRFYIGGSTVAYCPTSIQEATGCPPGNETVLTLCGMAVEVPGGQTIYITPRGEIGYTQGHSTYMPAGSLPCPFTYSKAPGAMVGRLGVEAFGARGLMACPTNGGLWQVFGNMQNATVPRGNVSQCLGFDALALDSTNDPAAWQYS